MEGTLHSQRLRWNCHRQAHTTGTSSRASDFCLPCMRHLHIIIASMGIEVYKYTDRFIDWELALYRLHLVEQRKYLTHCQPVLYSGQKQMTEELLDF
ncbi:hypothetical protein QL285_040015 [Trifolium repens]|nr:hypothetical protein QL285_040015 [Trifolium repens]